MTLSELRTILQSLSEPRVREFAQSLIPGKATILGVRIPRLRAIAKKLAREQWKEHFDSLAQAESMEEELIRGMIPGYAPRIPVTDRLSAIGEFLPRITNWSLCDTCCSTYSFARRNRELVWNWLQPLLHSEKEFEARFAVVMLLGHFAKSPEWAPAVAKALPEVPARGYYAEMALGWCLCELHIHFPDLADPLLAEGSSLRLSVKKLALRKIRESRRC